MTELTPEIVARIAELNKNASLPPAAPAPAPAPIPRRLLPRKITHVSFELEGWAGTFTLPSRNYLSQTEQQAILSAKPDLMRTVLGDLVDVLMDMNDEELKSFFEAWVDASKVTEGE